MWKLPCEISKEREVDYFQEIPLVEANRTMAFMDKAAFNQGTLQTNPVCNYEANDRFTVVKCISNASGLDIRFVLNSTLSITGMGALIKIEGFKDLKGFSIGYTDENSNFIHIRIRNTPLYCWFNLEFDHSDILFYINNLTLTPMLPVQINDIRIYIKGTPLEKNAKVSIQSLYVWRQNVLLPSWLKKEHPTEFNEQLLAGILRYWEHRFPNTQELDPAVSCYLAYGDKIIDWSSSRLLPENLMQVIEFRFSWHCWHHVSACLLKFLTTKEIKYLFSAVEYATVWLSQSYFQNDPDYKYTWYDHGTPSRLECMLVLYALLVKKGIHIHFTNVLRGAIYRHAMLLANEGFYAYNQPYRWHNHAAFQDMALIDAAVIMKDLPPSSGWLKTALARIKDFYDKILIKEDTFYVLYENSSSYHNGLISLIRRLDSKLLSIEMVSDTTKFIEGMERFSFALRYPDGRYPTFGDSYRAPNTPKSTIRKLATKDFYVFPLAGYSIIRGCFLDADYMLTFIASSASITHKHADNCSFSLYLDGVEWLIDPSYYSYQVDSPIPQYLRSSLAHNALTIDDLEYSVGFDQTSINGNRDGDDVHLEMSHTCYYDLEVRRYVTGNLTNLSYRFTDQIKPTANLKINNKAVRLMFHCGEGVVAGYSDGKTILTHPDSAFKLVIDGIQTKPLIHNGKISENPSEIRGITGQAFMQIHPIYTLEFCFENFSSITYEIKAEK